MRSAAVSETQFPIMVAYLRDSGGDAQDLSVTQQKDSLTRWADENHVNITQFYMDEARPGSTTVGREAFQHMINHFRQPVVRESGVLLWSFSRFARDINDASFFKADLRRRGFSVRAIQDTVPEGIDGVIFESLLDWKNARFLQDLSVDIKRGLAHNMTQYGAIGGVPPRGFKRQVELLGKRRDGSPHQISRWVPDPDTWEVCKLAWTMRAAGKTYREIHDVTHIYATMNSYSTFFTNRLYLGEMIFGGQVIKNYAEPLVDQLTWDAVQERMGKHHLGPAGSDNPDHPRRLYSSFLLSGLVYCARCGAPMNGSIVHFSEDQREYRYYWCSRVSRRHDCDATRVPKSALEAAVFQKLQDFALDPDRVYARQEALLRGNAALANEVNCKKDALNKQIGLVHTKIKNILDVLDEKGRKSAALTNHLAELETRETQLKNELMEMIDREVFGLGLISPDETRASAENILRNLNKEDPEELRKLFHGLIDHVTVEKDGKFIRGMIYFYGPPLKQKDPSTPDEWEDGSKNKAVFMPTVRCPHRDSNSGFSLERAASWSPRRWGQQRADSIRGQRFGQENRQNSLIIFPGGMRGICSIQS